MIRPISRLGERPSAGAAPLLLSHRLQVWLARAEQRPLPEATFARQTGTRHPSAPAWRGRRFFSEPFSAQPGPHPHKLTSQHSPPRSCAGWPVLPPNATSTGKFVHSLALSTISQLAGATCSRTSHCETFLGSARCAHWPSSNRQVDGHVSSLAHGNIEDQTLVLLEFGYS